MRQKVLARPRISAGFPLEGDRRAGAGQRVRADRAAYAPLLVALALAACAPGSALPQQPDSRSDLCSSCRMPVSDPSLAAQIVAPNEEPRFFDDLRCLRDYLAVEHSLPRGAVVYVADHRTRAWVEAGRAVFVGAPAFQTPMGSHWAAYADERSRQADPDAAGGVPVPASEIFGTAGPPGD